MSASRKGRRARIQRMIAYSGQDVRRDGPLAHKIPLETFWWDMHPNFGDEFTPFLLPRYGFMPLLRPPGEAKFFGAGSIVDMSMASTRAVFWGSGKMHEDRVSTRPDATVLALRGHLTREAMSIDDSIALGDPGLLAPRWIPRTREHSHIGIILHYNHMEDGFATQLRKRFSDTARFINPTRPLQTVVADISACSAVLTTSLHGLVVADAYGIPAAWALPDPVLPGGSFKFEDYESVVEPSRDRRTDIHRMRSADDVRRAAAGVSRSAVQHASLTLEDSLSGLQRASSPGAATATRLWHQYRYLLGRRH